MKDTYPNNLMERIIRLEESSEQFKDDIGDLKKDIKEVKSELCLWFKRVDTSVQELKFAQTRMSEIQFNNFIIGGEMPKICLDAGHNNSGIDTGTHGNGLREELLTLDICQLIKPLLQFNGFEVVMTREGDFVNGPHGTVNESLQTRCFIANSAQANLFVSVHINAGGGSGTEIFIVGRGGQAERAANMVLPYLVSAGGWANRGVKVENLYVLRNTNMPAILTENGFIDTFSDAAKLADTDFRQTIAVAHAKGICDYFGVQYKEGEINVPNHVIAYWSAKDYSVAVQISERLNNCLMTCRNAKPDLNPDAKAAKHLIVVGGPEVTDHPNVTNLCGATGPDTAILAANYAKSL